MLFLQEAKKKAKADKARAGHADADILGFEDDRAGSPTAGSGGVAGPSGTTIPYGGLHIDKIVLSRCFSPHALGGKGKSQPLVIAALKSAIPGLTLGKTGLDKLLKLAGFEWGTPTDDQVCYP